MTLDELKNNIQNDWNNLTQYSHLGSDYIIENTYLGDIYDFETDIEKFIDKCNTIDNSFYVFKANIYSINYQMLQICLSSMAAKYQYSHTNIYPNLVGYNSSTSKTQPAVSIVDDGGDRVTLPLTYIDGTTPGNNDLFFGSIIITNYNPGQE